MTIKTLPKRYKFARGVTWLFLVGSILLMVYTYSRSKIIFQGNLTEKYFIYYLISLAGVLFWGVVGRLKDEIKLNIAMVTTSLVVGLYLVEFALNFVDSFGWNDKFRGRSLPVGVEFDKRTKYQVYRDMKSMGVDVVPAVWPTEYFIKTKEDLDVERLFPIAGVSNKTTVYCNESGKYAIFLSDRYGFNNPDLEWDSSQIEWVLTGDSFTQGACVNPGEEIAGQIRSITGENVINLGMSGNGPLIELAALKEYAEARKPNIVLWVFLGDNDLEDLRREKQTLLLMSYLNPEFSQNLIHRQTEIDNKLSKYFREAEVKIEEKLKAKVEVERFKLLWETRVLRLYNIRRILGFDVLVDPIGSPFQLFSEILTKARDRTAAAGGELYFVYLPRKSRFTRGVITSSLDGKYNKMIGMVKNLNLPVIDIFQEVFANNPDPLSLFPLRGNHYTAEGYSEIAKAIVSRVRNEQKRDSSAE